MENTQNVQIAKKEITLQLVDGEFTIPEASEVITSLINQKINFHKIKALQNWERNHKYEEEPIRNRIEELETALKQTAEFMSELKNSGSDLKINGVIKISIVE